MSGGVRVELEGRVAVLTVDDPDRRNALTVDLCDAMVQMIDALEADTGVGALVITGAPPAFCAGADLSQLGASQHDGLRRIYSGFLRVAECSLPTVAAVNGAAVGAGMNLALACDLRLAGPQARFDTRFLDLGIHPGGGHTWMMRHLVGPQTTAATVLFGQILDAAEAARMGLVWRAVDGDVVAAAVDLANRAADAPRELVVRVKATIRDMAQISTHAEAVDRELEDQVWSINQPAFAEKLAAMQAKISRRAQ
jgi:enoyl-CoA hydratase